MYKDMPEAFWLLYRSIKKHHPEYSKKRLITVTRYAWKKKQK